MTMIDPVPESVPADLKALGGGGLKKLFGHGPSDEELKTIFVPFGVDDVSPYQPVIDAVAPWLATSLGTSVSVRGGAIWAVGAELRYKRTSLDTLWGLAFTAAAALTGHEVAQPQTTPMQPREPGAKA